MGWHSLGHCLCEEVHDMKQLRNVCLQLLGNKVMAVIKHPSV